jgi:hypothetical protein
MGDAATDLPVPGQKDSVGVGIVNLLSSWSSARLMCHTRGMRTPLTNRYKHHRFPAEIISHGIWLYCRFCLSYHDVEELLFARGIITLVVKKFDGSSQQGSGAAKDRPSTGRLGRAYGPRESLLGLRPDCRRPGKPRVHHQ